MVHILPPESMAMSGCVARFSFVLRRRALRRQGRYSAAVFVPVVKTAALFVNGGQTYLSVKDTSMRWIRREPGFRETLDGRGRPVWLHTRGMIRPASGLAIVNVLLISLLLVGCSAPWNGKLSTVMPTPTPQFAG